MFVRKWLAALSAVLIVLCPVIVAYGEESKKLSQAYTWEQNVDIFVEGELDSQNISCKISNQEAEIIESGLLTNVGATIRTTLLVDISTSIPSSVRERVVGFIHSMIETIGVGEEYQIVTFGEHLNVLQEFTSDPSLLSNAADNIVFDGQYSIVYDSIFNTIPSIEPIDGRPCYYRTIVITDGVDDTASGVTKEELYLCLKEGNYPIDVVEVSKSKNGEANKELSALTRISGGSYGNLYPESDYSDILHIYKRDTIFWIRGVIPGPLLDGSVRQVDISDGTTNFTVDVKVPVFDVPVSQQTEKESLPPETIEETTTVEETMETESLPEETESTLFDAGKSQSDVRKIIAIAGAGIGAAIGLVIVVILIVIMKRKKKASPSQHLPEGSYGELNDRTEILREEPKGGNLSVRVKNRTDGRQIWDLAIGQGVLVGRGSHCQICIVEGSVAREQCQLYQQAPGSVMIKNLSTSNITCLNGQKVQRPMPLQSGYLLTCGRITLVIESIYSSGSYDTEDLNKMTTFVNV